MRIDDNDFALVKKSLPLCTNNIKPSKQAILEFYNDMNEQIDNINLNSLDIEHPRDVYERKAQQDKNFKKRFGTLDDWLLWAEHFVSQKYMYRIGRYF